MKIEEYCLLSENLFVWFLLLDSKESSRQLHQNIAIALEVVLIRHSNYVIN